MLLLHALSIYTDFVVAPLLPRETIEEQFQKSKAGFEERWDRFKHNRQFISFSPGRPSEEIEAEFKQLKEVRRKTWFRNPEAALKESCPGFEVSQSLFYEDGARFRNCIAFAYNNTIPYFNASTIHFSHRKGIACEGARPKDVPCFLALLVSHRVTHLVRLTKARENDMEKCHPYWEGLLSQASAGDWTLRIPLDDKASYDLNYFFDDDWNDNAGVDPKRLLDLVLKVKRSVDTAKGLLAVHCSAGVGRTGTFFAALSIVDAIDRQEPLSIEEITYRLSLQRINSVATAAQYVSLYRLAELYQQYTDDMLAKSNSPAQKVF